VPPRIAPQGVIPDWLYHLADEAWARPTSWAGRGPVRGRAGGAGGRPGAGLRAPRPGPPPALAGALNGIRAWLRLRYRALIDGDDELRRLFICLDLGITVMKGVFEDGVIRNGFDVINDIDFRDWLRKHGGDEQFSVNSAPVRGFYDLVFAYEGGDFDKPNIEAGTLLRAMARIGLAYKGGIMFKMQAGMGDTIFTPMYQVLARGVKFKFFHKVEELVPGAGDIGSIRMTQQVQLRRAPATRRWWT
jgi:hypothetical protein